MRADVAGMSAISSSLTAGLANVDLSSQVSVRVARMTLDQAQEQGKQMVELLQSASKVAKTSQGTNANGLDVTA